MNIYDVLAYIAYAKPPISREKRVQLHRAEILKQYEAREGIFLEFVLAQYIKAGVYELDSEKLPRLIELKYHAVSDAVKELGDIQRIREMFLGLQRALPATKEKSCKA